MASEIFRLKCPNCGALYEIPRKVIPKDGRTVKCSSCEHIWFYKLDSLEAEELSQTLEDEKSEEASLIDKAVGDTSSTELESRDRDERPISSQETGLSDKTSELESDSLSNDDAVSTSDTFEHAFRSFAPLEKPIIQKIINVSPVEMEVHEEKLGIRNSGRPGRLAPRELANRIRAIDSHVNQVISECDSKQIPDDFRKRLKNYSVSLQEEPPFYLMLDGPMSFIQGALNDTYVTEALDGGFLEACRLLVRMHQEIRPLLIGDEIAEDELPEVKSETQASEAMDFADSVIEVFDDPSVEHEVRDALRAAKEYFQAAATDVERRLSLLRRGLSAVGGIVSGTIAGAAGTALYVWSSSPAGAAVLVQLQSLMSRLLTFFSG